MIPDSARRWGQCRRDHCPGDDIALKAVLPEAEEELTPGERALLSEWLDRIADPAR